MFPPWALCYIPWSRFLIEFCARKPPCHFTQCSPDLFHPTAFLLFPRPVGGQAFFMTRGVPFPDNTPSCFPHLLPMSQNSVCYFSFETTFFFYPRIFAEPGSPSLTPLSHPRICPEPVVNSRCRDVLSPLSTPVLLNPLFTSLDVVFFLQHLFFVGPHTWLCTREGAWCPFLSFILPH